jgi:SAM-dependent methyltransferase
LEITLQPETATIARPIGISPSLVESLHCPYCGTSLKVEESKVSKGEVLENAVVTCGCYQYPIVSGILILQHLEDLPSIVALVRQNDEKGAVLRALDLFRIKWAHRTKFHQYQYRVKCKQLVTNRTATFEDAVRLVRTPKMFGDYLFHRYANVSFLGAAGAMQIFKPLDSAARGTRLLDFGCGCGHSSFLLQTLFPNISIFSADQDFVSLYLARRFLAPDGVHLCLDAEAPSPFPDGFFEAAFCLDAFHYFRSKLLSLQELDRITASDALWLFPHLHNVLQTNVTPGIPLSPQDYTELFAVRDGRLFNESDFLKNLVESRSLDLAARPGLKALEQAQTFTMVAGAPDVFRRYSDFPTLLDSNRELLTINPIYAVTERGGTLDLTLEWPNEVIARECKATESIVPPRFELSRRKLKAAVEGTESEGDYLNDLLARFILVPLPRSYLRQDRSVAAILN